MQYALLGDIHSSKEALEKVLAHIQKTAPDAKLVGTGDLYECTVSKKDITDHKFSNLADVMLMPEGFTALLTFPSVRGNQEERILSITETVHLVRESMSELPETIQIAGAEIIHGHQWAWGGNPWTLLHADVTHSLTFYGHSHESALTINGRTQKIDFGTPYAVDGEQVLVNVGAVVEYQEWVLYDSVDKTVIFHVC